MEAVDGLVANGRRAEAAGDGALARELYQQALARAPASGAANFHLGHLLYSQGAMAEAEAFLALAARAQFPAARTVRGFALHRLGRLEEAAGELRAGLAARPDDPQAQATLFHILEALGKPSEAVVALEGLLRLRPDWTEARYNYASTLMTLGRDAEAEVALRQVLERDPSFAIAYRMAANLLHRQGRIDETLVLCQTGRRALPQHLELESFELFALNFSPDVPADTLFERHRAFGLRLEAETSASLRFPPRPAGRPLRIGYVSGDFSYHPVGLFMAPLLEGHDRARFQAYCYSTGTQVDDLTRRLRESASVWRDVHALPDPDLAALIHGDEIDILVDLAGHSGSSRLGVFARKPAPVQAAWLGYLNTTGLTRIDYRITDAYCDPIGLTEARHTETLVRLPHTQWCYRPFVSVTAAAELPLERNGHVTFGSFTQIAKLSRTTLELWAKILDALPGARLLIAGVARGAAAERLSARLEARGITAERVEFAPFLPVVDYLRLYDRVDIALDPTPYSGGTSTCDALWMGVPVLTLPGERPASRSAGSILTALALHEWIARDADDYVRRAVEHAQRPSELALLRRSLRERMLASPLTDEALFARELEQAFDQMWRRREKS